MSTPQQTKAKRYNKGGLIATGLSALMTLAMLMLNTSLMFVAVLQVTALNEASLAMAISATIVLLLWSFSPSRSWWQGVMAWVGGSFLPLFLVSAGTFPRTVKVSLFTFVYSFLAFPLLWFGFKRPHQMHNNSLKILSYVLCFVAAGVILLGVLSLPAIGSITLDRGGSAFGGFIVRSIGSPVTYINYFPVAGVLFLILAGVSILLAFSSKKELLLYIGGAAVLGSIFHYLLGSVPESGQFFTLRGEQHAVYGKIHGEAWAGLIIGSLLILLGGLINQAPIRDWLLRRNESLEIDTSVTSPGA